MTQDETNYPQSWIESAGYDSMRFPRTAEKSVFKNWMRFNNLVEDAVMFATVNPARYSVDVGCSHGRFTGWLGRLSRRVYAIDPQFDQFSNVNITPNWWTEPDMKRIVYIGTALGDQEESATLYGFRKFDSYNTAWASLWPNSEGKGLEKATETPVSVETLDSLLGLKDIGFIKIDAEGHDRAVLRGASEIIKRSRPIIIGESHWPYEMLTARKYDIWPLAWPVAKPLRDDPNKILLNYLAIPQELTVAYIQRIRKIVNPLVDLFVKTQDTEACCQLLSNTFTAGLIEREQFFANLKS